MPNQLLVLPVKSWVFSALSALDKVYRIIFIVYKIALGQICIQIIFRAVAAA